MLQFKHMVNVTWDTFKCYGAWERSISFHLLTFCLDFHKICTLSLMYDKVQCIKYTFTCFTEVSLLCIVTYNFPAVTLFEENQYSKICDLVYKHIYLCQYLETLLSFNTHKINYLSSINVLYYQYIIYTNSIFISIPHTLFLQNVCCDACCIQGPRFW
jgi:hypothetical protein